MMVPTVLRLFFVSYVLLFSPWVKADELYVVMGKAFASESVSLKQLANIYRRKTMINRAGERWNPVNLSANDPLRLAFSAKIFHQPAQVMEAYWNAQYFQGIMPPYVVSSVEAMLRLLETTPGAIGYVLPCQVDQRVKVVLKVSVKESVSEACRP